MMISIVVPVYNAEKYLNSSIQSVLKQDYLDWELLLIDDGSTDSSPAICDSFAEADDRVRVIHKENKGVSVARNTGLENAQGEYIAFMDADDEMRTDMLSSLYSYAEKFDADMVSCSSGYVVNGEIVREEFGTNKLNVYEQEEALMNFLIGKTFNIGVWTKLFRKSLLKDIRFLEDKKINEDKYFIFEALLKSKKIVLYDVTKYLYFKREGSATTREFDSRWFDSLDLADMIENSIIEKRKELSLYATVNTVQSYYWMLLKMYRSVGSIERYPEQYKRIINLLKQADVWKIRKYLTKNMFVQILMIQISEPLLRKVKQRR